MSRPLPRTTFSLGIPAPREQRRLRPIRRAPSSLYTITYWNAPEVNAPHLRPLVLSQPKRRVLDQMTALSTIINIIIIIISIPPDELMSTSTSTIIIIIHQEVEDCIRFMNDSPLAQLRLSKPILRA